MIVVNQYALSNEVRMPLGSSILSVQNRFGSPKIWALVDTEAPLCSRRFFWHKTGEELSAAIGDLQMGTVRHVATVQADHDMYSTHIFEDFR